MTVIYNPELKGWQIVYTEHAGISRKLWGKPVNDKVYASWDEALHVLDKWAE